MKSLQNFTRKCPLLMGILMVAYVWCAVRYIPDIPGYYGSAFKELILAVAAVIIAFLFVRPAVINPSMTGVGWQFKHSIYYIIINIVIMGLMMTLVMLNALFKNQINGGDILKGFVSAGIVSIGVGFLEEIVFRVFLFGGLVAVLGKTKKV